MANGKVLTGFSLPVVSLYSNSGTTISYSSFMALARGVDVAITPTTSSDNKFFADNQAAENSKGIFTDGAFTLTVDGLKAAAEKLIMGLPTADADDFVPYGDDQNIPYVGIGFIARYMEDGVESFVPYVIPKCTFDYFEVSAATQQQEISYQTQKLTGKIFRSDDAKHNWKFVGEDQTSEAAAYAMLQDKLGYVAPTPGGGT